VGEKKIEAKKQIPFKDASPEQTLQQLQTNPNQGLTQGEAQKRLEESGPNELAEEQINPIWTPNLSAGTCIGQSLYPRFSVSLP
jgi:magnesium-transporting ATPase (P-type)